MSTLLGLPLLRRNKTPPPDFDSDRQRGRGAPAPVEIKFKTKYKEGKKNMKKKVISIVAVVLVLCCAIGGTLAWLTAKSAVVTNTFAPSNIKIELKETTGENYKMIPGYTITKDPKATVLAGSEECWLFVKIEKSGNFDQYLTYEPANGWEPVAEETNVYARKVTTAEIGTAYSVLLNNQVTVKSDVTEAMMEGLNTANYPTLTITAYASQLYKSAGVEFTAAEAWANAPKA